MEFYFKVEACMGMEWVFLMAAAVVAGDVARKRVRHYRLIRRLSAQC